MMWCSTMMVALALACLPGAFSLLPEWQIRSNQIQAYLKFDSSLQVDVTSKDDKETITVTLKNTDTAAAKKAQALATLLYPYGNQQWQGGAVITHVVFNGAVVVRKALPTDADNALALTKLAMTGNTLYRQSQVVTGWNPDFDVSGPNFIIIDCQIIQYVIDQTLYKKCNTCGFRSETAASGMANVYGTNFLKTTSKYIPFGVHPFLSVIVARCKVTIDV